MNQTSQISVIGAGAWGTALAAVLARAGHTVTLWAREADVVTSVNNEHENTLYLPGVPLPEGIRATSGLKDAAGAELILLVTPAQHLGRIASDLSAHLAPKATLVICAKGVERNTNRLMTEVLAEACPNATPAVLSGPSFAADVAKGKPTAVTIAAETEAKAQAIADQIGQPFFRPYAASDMIGVQLGGALKNVLAIACGIVEGRGYGDSARAALTTRGFAEMTRLGVALGARRETLSGLSGLGDLILTCSSLQSRNMSLGAALGQGKTLQTIMEERRSVAEGVHTAKAVLALANKHQIEMPIAEAVDAIVSGTQSVEEAITGLLARPFTREI